MYLCNRYPIFLCPLRLIELFKRCSILCSNGPFSLRRATNRSLAPSSSYYSSSHTSRLSQCSVRPSVPENDLRLRKKCCLLLLFPLPVSVRVLPLRAKDLAVPELRKETAKDGGTKDTRMTAKVLLEGLLKEEE